MVPGSGGETDHHPRQYDCRPWGPIDDGEASFEQATVRYKCYPVESTKVKMGLFLADAAIQFIVGMILIGLLCLGYVIFSGSFGGI